MRTPALPGSDRDRHARIGLMAAVAIVSVALWQIPLGALVLYPFTILATWFHEMGHGLAALLTGSRFDHLVVFADGSGYAAYLSPADQWRVTRALVAASGPMGPAIAGSLLILASRSPQSTRRALIVLGWALILSTAIWVRSLVGWAMLPAIGAAILLLAAGGSASHQRLGIQILGVQACISVWRSFDYLFSSGGHVGGRVMVSDTGTIANALLLPYWFWGAAISVAVVAMLWISLRSALRR